MVVSGPAGDRAVSETLVLVAVIFAGCNLILYVFRNVP